MLYIAVKIAHIIFIVTWFAGLFYIVRLFVYNAEAGEKPQPERDILRRQYSIMIRRLWLGITWPSAILTLILGPWMAILYGSLEPWLEVKLLFVLGLYAYHWSLHTIYKQQRRGDFRWTSFRLRLYNEVATLFLAAIVALAVGKSAVSWIRLLGGLALFAVLLALAAKIYQYFRHRKTATGPVTGNINTPENLTEISKGRDLPQA